MGIYISIYISFIIYYLISTIIKDKEQKQRFLCIACFLSLWIVQALRSVNIGIDLVSYIAKFLILKVDNITELFYIDTESRFEYGYQIYMNFVHIFLSHNPNVFLAVTSFCVLAPISYVIYKRSDNPILSFTVFASLVIYALSFSGLRQSLAIAIGVLAIHNLINNNTKWFIALVFLASQFHTSALIIVFLLGFSRKQLSNKQLSFLFFCGIFLIVGLTRILPVIVELMFAEDKYKDYLENNGGGAYMLFLFFVIVYIFALKLKKRDGYFLKVVLGFAVTLQSIGMVAGVATRIAYYFYVFLMIIVPLTIKEYRFSPSTNQIIYIGCFLFFAVFFLSNLSETNKLIPYKFFWE